MTSDLRSAPIITLSLASSNSDWVTMRLLRRAAVSAASLTRFIRSAPEKPGVPRAMVLRLISGASGTLRTCTLRICSRPTTSGFGTTTWRSKRPGRSSAGSSTSGRLVAAIRITPSLASKPSISTSNWFSVCPPPAFPPPRAGAEVAADGVDFVDEDDAGRVLLGLFEHVPDTRGADADEHLDEVRARGREERNIGPARDRARDQRLAGAGGADQQHATWNPSAEPLILAGVA